MSKNAIPGFDGRLLVEVATVPTVVADIRDVTLTITHAVIDATTHDDAPWTVNIEGRRSWTVSAEALYFEGDAGQEELLTAIFAGTTVQIDLRPQTGSGNREFSGQARMTSYEHAEPNDDATATSLELEGCGALSDVTQP